MGRKFRKIENFVDKNSIGVYAENTMNGNNNPDNGGACQADCNWHSEPAATPTLWNASLGRRSFMKKTGSATAAAAIAMHGFRMEVLATASGVCACGRPKVTVGFTATRTREYMVSGGNSAGVTNLQNWLTALFDPGNSDESLENASINQGFTGTNVPLKEGSHNGQTTFLNPATFDVVGPTFSPVVERPLGSGNLYFTATIYVTRRNEAVVSCP